MQKLYERLKDRKDVQVVTLNVDDNVGLVGPFMKENKYTFPVIPAQFLMQQLVPSLAIPLNWIVDASGVVRLESVGFGADAEKWVDQVVEAIEKARAGT
jgi:hypothetical protein